MVTDTLPSIAPKNTYKYALNAVFGDREYGGYGLSNEESNSLVCDLGGKIVGYTHIDERDWTLIFLKEKDGASSLYYYDHKKDSCEFILSDKEFGCNFCFDDCEFKYGEVKSFGACNDLHVYFSSCCTYFKVNIDEMLAPKRKQSVKDCQDCSYFQMFKCVCEPSLSLTTTDNNGSIAEAGSLGFAVKLGDAEGNFTNYSSISRFLTLGSDNNNSGDVANQGATLHLTGLDPTYNRVTIAIIRKVGGITTVEELPSQAYTGDGFTFNYYGQQGTPLDISDVTVKSKAFIRGQDMYQKDGRMFFYNIVGERNVNYQKYANKIQIGFTEYETTLEEAKRHQLPSFVRGENYAFGITLKYCDGTKSKVFHIPYNAYQDITSGSVIDNNTNLNISTPKIITGDSDSYDFQDESSEWNYGNLQGNVVTPNQGSKTKEFKTSEGCCPILINKTNRSKTLRGDQWVDAIGNQLTETQIVEKRTFAAKKYESVLQYPEIKDCDGVRMYPNGNITYHTTPTNCESPFYVSQNNGVRNRWQPERDEFGNIRVRLLGISLSNIVLPKDEELPKPLCPNSPYEIVYVQRTEQNKSVLAKGILTGMFKGNVYGKDYLYPRHGVNSFEHVDRFIAPQGNTSSRMGELYEGEDGKTAYNFHSLDTDCDRPYLPATHIRYEHTLTGGGFKHGMYSSETTEPEDSWNGQEIHQKGTRISNNLSKHYCNFTNGNSATVLLPITGLTYAPSNSIVTNPPGISYPLNNRYRESSVYLEIEGKINIDGDWDKSFVGDVNHHWCPLWAKAAYVSLIRELPDQYGSVEGLKYCSLNIHARDVHCNSATTIKGIAGDTFLTPYTKRRTSYVSDKIGDTFSVINSKGEVEELGICSSSISDNDADIGLRCYTDLPTYGDLSDPRNYAGLHTIAGGGTSSSDLSRTCEDARAQTGSESDYYYPQTLTGLVHFMQESSISGCNLTVGDEYADQVNWANLRLLGQDPSLDGNTWEDNYLTRVFYCEVRQPSRRQKWVKSLFMTFVNIIDPILNLSDILTTSMTNFSLSTYFTEDTIDTLLGIEKCNTDNPDSCIRNFQDNWCNYNNDYNCINCLEGQYGLESTYNTCACNTCEKGNTTNEIYHTNKQNTDSEVDAYTNVGINAYNELPAEAGGLRRLFEIGGRLHAQTSDSIYQLQEQVGNFTNNVELITGTNSLLLYPRLVAGTNSFGLIGTNHPNASIDVPGVGYFTIDSESNKIYKLSANGQIPISDIGMGNFFRDSLGFCKTDESCCDCFDEKSENGIFYSVGYDPMYRRVLFTKSDGDFSFTASFDPRPTQDAPNGRWVSFHSYYPQGYFNNRKDLFSYIDGKIYKHNIEGDYQTFYGDKESHIILTNVSDPSLNCYSIESIETFTEADTIIEGYPVGNIETTFDTMAVWNNYQSTGTMPVSTEETSTGVQASRTCGVWRYDGLWNKVPQDCRDFTPTVENQSRKCTPMKPLINNEIIDEKNQLKPTDGNTKLYDRNNCIYLEYSGGDCKTRLRTLLIDTKITKDETIN